MRTDSASMKNINVAISIHISDIPGVSIWSNGAMQHAIFLCQLLENIPYINNVWLVTYGSYDGDEKWLLEDYSKRIVHIKNVVNDVDLLIEMTEPLTSEDVDTVSANGGKFITYRIGHSYVRVVESVLFDAHNNWAANPNNLKADAIWTNAQFEYSCGSFFEVTYNSKLVVLPHLWSPFFLKKALSGNPRSALGWPYSHKTDKIKISIFEPNLSVVKTTLIPFLISAEYYKKYKEQVSNIFMYNTLITKDIEAFKKIVMNTDAGRDRVATCEGRYSIVDALGQEGGVVVSHHWENGLNYLFYEALYGGFPLVHNSDFLKDYGYYYEGFDINDGVRALENAVAEHNNNLNSYKKKSSLFLETVNPNARGVINSYDKAIRNLFHHSAA